MVSRKLEYIEENKNMVAKKKGKDTVIKNVEKKEIKDTSNNQMGTKISALGKEEEKTGAKERRRRKKIKTVSDLHPLEKFGPVRKLFILEHIRTVNYRDMAKLIGIKSDELQASVEKMGIKLPIERAHAWSEIDFGQYRSITDCARCQVQRNHSTFFVGINNCRKCYEKNIKHWIKEEVVIDLRFPSE